MLKLIAGSKHQLELQLLPGRLIVECKKCHREWGTAGVGPSSTGTPIFPPIESFVGTWFNVDVHTRSWIKIEITSEGDTLTAHFWGACHPTDCDAGSTSALYGGDPVLMILDSGFAISYYTFSLNDDTLHVTTLTHFTDNSGREDLTLEDDFQK